MLILQMIREVKCAQLFFVTVRAFDALSAEDIEKATETLLNHETWTKDNWLAKDYGPDEFVLSLHSGRLEQIFTVTSTRDGRMHALVMPFENGDNAWGPGPFSEYYEPYKKTFRLPEVRSSADYNMIVSTGAVVAAVGWAFLRESVLRFSRGDFGGQDAAIALREGALYHVQGHVVRIAANPCQDALIAALA